MSILATLKLGEKLSAKYIVLLGSLLALLSFRFYVFYMICVAIAGAFVIGMQSVTAKSFARQFSPSLLLGLALTYIGVTRSASIQFETLRNLQTSAAQSAGSGTLGGVRFWTGRRRLHHHRRPFHNSTGPTLFAVRSVPLADRFFAAEYYVAGDGHLVGFVSVVGVGVLVCTSSTACE